MKSFFDLEGLAFKLNFLGIIFLGAGITVVNKIKVQGIEQSMGYILIYLGSLLFLIGIFSLCINEDKSKKNNEKGDN